MTIPSRFDILLLGLIGHLFVLCSQSVQAEPERYWVSLTYDDNTPGWGVDRFAEIQSAIDAAPDDAERRPCFGANPRRLPSDRLRQRN